EEVAWRHTLTGRLASWAYPAASAAESGWALPAVHLFPEVGCRLVDPDLLVGVEKALDLAPQGLVAGARPVQEGRPLGGLLLQGCAEDGFGGRRLTHDRAPGAVTSLLSDTRKRRATPHGEAELFLHVVVAALQFAVQPGAGEGPPALGGGD